MVEFQITEDGSHTLFSEMAGQTYHSSHGAVQESRHIFIDAALAKAQNDMGNARLSVLEIGFGTGLNALLTAQWARENGVKIEYTTIELYPLAEGIYRELNYGRLLGDEELFLKLHEKDWDVDLQCVTENFAITKCKSDIVEWLNS
jgi:tRNA U34 5-methylaminomethyl-2-thiouridine-forming methyltransferase MnmC